MHGSYSEILSIQMYLIKPCNLTRCCPYSTGCLIKLSYGAVIGGQLQQVKHSRDTMPEHCTSDVLISDL